MMVGRTRSPSYTLDTHQLVLALFGAGSDEAGILDLAAMGEVDLFADGRSWNAFLWLAMNTFKGADGTPIWSGEDLGRMKEELPITFS